MVFDACDAARARQADVLLVDTAGRLHTQDHLMRELTKIRDVVARKIPGAPHEVLLVLDATTGQNAINQAKAFTAAIDVTGIFLAKLDGTAKGGIVVAIRNEVNLPVKFVGIGRDLRGRRAVRPGPVRRGPVRLKPLRAFWQVIGDPDYKGRGFGHAYVP